MRRLTRSGCAARALATTVLVAATGSGCAAPGMPPGGPVDRDPPALLRVRPDSGALNARIREVIFRFDEVVSERPRGAASLEQIIVVSPSDGPVNVSWRREAIAIRPRRDWRANTAYTVTILPGLSDLRGNATAKPLHTEFSTGSVIPGGALRGVAFDWIAQRVASGARIEAMIAADTMLKYVAAADTAGRFALTSLPAGTFRVRAFVDQNGNRALDARRELWDSTSVSVRDSARYDFYLFAHDSIGQRPAVTPTDSVTLRVKFDKPLLPSAPLDASRFVLWRTSDSAITAVRRALPAAEFDSLLAARKKSAADSAARADTTAAGQRARARADSVREAAVRDSISRAQIAALQAARDTARREPLPVPARATPSAEYVLELARPLASGTGMRLEVRDAAGLSGARRTSQVAFLWRRPAPRDSAATKAPPVKKP